MKITDVVVKKNEYKGNTRVKAIASVLLDDCFAVHEIRVIEGKEGLFIAMPSRKRPDGTFRDIAHPINPETRSMLEKVIIDAYKNMK